MKNSLLLKREKKRNVLKGKEMASYLETMLRKALGAEQIKGKQGYDYGSWSPNNVRGIYLFTDSIVIEYFVYKNYPYSVTPLDLRKVREDHERLSDKKRRGVQIGIKQPFKDIFEDKMFQNIEEIVIQKTHLNVLNIDGSYSNMLLFPNFIEEIQQKQLGKRLRNIGLLEIDANTSPVQMYVRGELEGHRDRRKEGVLFCEELAEMGLQVANIPMEGKTDWRNRIGLTPIFYPLDVKAGPLETALSQIKDFAVASQWNGKEKGVEEKEYGHKDRLQYDKDRPEEVKTLFNFLDFLETHTNCNEWVFKQIVDSVVLKEDKPIFCHDEETPNKDKLYGFRKGYLKSLIDFDTVVEGGRSKEGYAITSYLPLVYDVTLTYIQKNAFKQLSKYIPDSDLLQEENIYHLMQYYMEKEGGMESLDFIQKVKEFGPSELHFSDEKLMTKYLSTLTLLYILNQEENREAGYINEFDYWCERTMEIWDGDSLRVFLKKLNRIKLPYPARFLLNMSFSNKKKMRLKGLKGRLIEVGMEDLIEQLDEWRWIGPDTLVGNDEVEEQKEGYRKMSLLFSEEGQLDLLIRAQALPLEIEKGKTVDEMLHILETFHNR